MPIKYIGQLFHRLNILVIVVLYFLASISASYILGMGRAQALSSTIFDVYGTNGRIDHEGFPSNIKKAVGPQVDVVLALTEDGHVFYTGPNSSGVAGIDPDVEQVVTTPVEVTGLQSIVDIDISTQGFAVALDANGDVWTWGAIIGLGRGLDQTSIDRGFDYVPAKVTEVSNVTQISTSTSNVLALISSGEVWSWGSNNFGQIGNGEMTESPEIVVGPIKIANLDQVTWITSGTVGSAVVKADGSVWRWGGVQQIEGFEGAFPIFASPTQVVGLSSITKLATGDGTFFALDSSGHLYVYGDNRFGQLGLGSYVGLPTRGGIPYTTVPLLVDTIENVTDIDGSIFTIVARTQDGSLFKWGYSFVDGCGLCTIQSLPTLLDNFASSPINFTSVSGVARVVGMQSTDSSPPTLGLPLWSANPKSISQIATLTVGVVDTGSGIAGGEYFLGDTDPGQGNGAMMSLNGSNLTSTFGTDFPTGVYRVNIRAKDIAGNWSDIISDFLVVYNPDGPRMTGKKAIVPSLGNGDVLPGLISGSQTDKASFGFNVKYGNQGQIHPSSDLQLSYSTGTKCNKPAQAQNCHTTTLNATSIAWLTTQDTNNSTGIFQGTANLNVDGAASTVIFRVTGRDGARFSPTANDQFQIKIYAQGADPNTATPVYRINLVDIEKGSVKIL